MDLLYATAVDTRTRRSLAPSPDKALAPLAARDVPTPLPSPGIKTEDEWMEWITYPSDSDTDGKTLVQGAERVAPPQAEQPTLPKPKMARTNSLLDIVAGRQEARGHRPCACGDDCDAPHAVLNIQTSFVVHPAAAAAPSVLPSNSDIRGPEQALHDASDIALPTPSHGRVLRARKPSQPEQVPHAPPVSSTKRKRTRSNRGQNGEATAKRSRRAGENVKAASTKGRKKTVDRRNHLGAPVVTEDMSVNLPPWLSRKVTAEDMEAAALLLSFMRQCAPRHEQ